jgi:peroxiredoxin
MITRCARLLIVLVVGLAAGAAWAADAPKSPRGPAVLQLFDGGFAAGELDASPQPGVLRWQAADFVSPFEFPMTRVIAVHWTPAAVLPKPSGDFCFELSGGDVVFGSLTALDDKDAQLDLQRIGRIQMPRGMLHRIYRWRDSEDLIYLGPNGLNGWQESIPPRLAPITNVVIRNGVRQTFTVEPPPAQPGWREEAGQIVTDREGASIRGDFGLPARASIEFELSWKSKPDFVFALGTSDKDESIKRAFRFEAWGTDLVIQRELEKEADLAVVQEIQPGVGRTHLQVYLDQEAGMIQVFSPSGKQLAELKVGATKLPVFPGLYLANLRGDLRLEWLRISRWGGELPRGVKTDQSRIHRTDGAIVYGKVTRFDAGSNEFVIRSDSGESRIARHEVSSVFFSLPADEKPRSMRAVYQDGSRLSGDLDKIEKGALVLTVGGVKEPLRVPVAGLRSLLVLQQADQTPLPKDDATGRLELDGLRLAGKLVDGRAQPGSSSLAWQPLASKTASALKPGVAGRIIYKEPPPPAPRVVQATDARIFALNGQVLVEQARRPGAIAQNFAAALAESEMRTEPRLPEERRSLFLRDGDVIPSVVTKIDEKGVWFRSSLSSSTFVANDKVKAVELAVEAPSTTVIRLPRSKQTRLLTLPRMQKASPPTHLIRSKNGDFLRGRLSRMDDKTLRVEVHLDDKEIPRDRISRIIWLHEDELDPAKKPAPPDGPNSATRVQALRNDGVRLTFVAESFAGTTLSGKSDVLGPCQVAVRQMDQLLIGGAIDKAAAQLPYQQWKLTNAPEPKYVTAGEGDEGGGGGDGGLESPLVGKPAPDFALDLVGGKKFRLAENKGKVVVLDFWATWCGPCLQAMPQVERAAAEFKDQDVRLVAVNLQETAAQVTALLERQKLNLTVALDRDGTVAEQYKAVAIPQTVIIDREGKVARLFVGGGPHLEDQLRQALKAVLAGDKPDEPQK